MLLVHSEVNVYLDKENGGEGEFKYAIFDIL
jgi:hypothetical protein